MTSQSPNPNVFLIGFPKCGTTAIARFCAEHPEGFIADIKEPSFWSSDFKKGQTMFRLDTLDDYVSLYEAAENQSIILDASTSYITSQVAIERILEFNPDAKFVVMVRHPVQVTHAYHMEKVFNCQEDEPDFEAAWRLQSARQEGQNVPSVCVEPKVLQYHSMMSLGTHLARAKDLIPDGQLAVFFHEDFVKEPRRLWLDLQAFLGVEDDGRTEFPALGSAHFNRFPKLARLYQNPPSILLPVIRALKRRAQASAHRGGIGAHIKKALLSGKKRAPLSEAFKEELHVAFEDEIQLLEKVTGRDLSHWRYGV